MLSEWPQETSASAPRCPPLWLLAVISPGNNIQMMQLITFFNVFNFSIRTFGLRGVYTYFFYVKR